MTVHLELVDARDAARIVDALLAQALAEGSCRPMVATRYVELANRIGDAMDPLGLPAHAPTLDPLDPTYGDILCVDLRCPERRVMHERH